MLLCLCVPSCMFLLKTWARRGDLGYVLWPQQQRLMEIVWLSGSGGLVLVFLCPDGLFVLGHSFGFAVSQLPYQENKGIGWDHLQCPFQANAGGVIIASVISSLGEAATPISSGEDTGPQATLAFGPHVASVSSDGLWQRRFGLTASGGKPQRTEYEITQKFVFLVHK